MVLNDWMKNRPKPFGQISAQPIFSLFQNWNKKLFYFITKKVPKHKQPKVKSCLC
jgi:hypothetical protein